MKRLYARQAIALLAVMFLCGGTFQAQAQPSVPVATAATNVAATSFTANWNSSSGASRYYLDVSTSNTFSSFVSGYNGVNVGNVTSASVTGLTAGVTYYYRVRAGTFSQTSGNSNTITQMTLPTTPTATAASSATQSAFNANWNAATGAAGYRLDVATNNTFVSLVTGYDNLDVANVTTYPVTGLTSGATYYYRVRAYNAAGTTVSSGTITAGTLPDPPVATAATSVAATSFSANWGAVSGATSYRLDVSTSNTFGTFVGVYNNLSVPSGVTQSVTGLTAGVTYYYRVRAVSVGGTSANSNTITQGTLPATPVATAGTFTSQTFFIANWNAATGAAGYRLDVATDNLFTAFVVGFNNLDVANTLSDSITGLTAGTTYYYRVRAYNANGTTVNSNTITQATLANAPGAPTATAASSLAATSFAANWNTAAGATGYFLDVATDNLFTSFVTNYNNRSVGNVLTFSVTGLTAGGTYYYRVRASNAGGTSANSNTITQGTLPTTPVATAGTFASQTFFIANWNAATGAAGYRLDVATDNLFTTFVAGFNNLDVANTLNDSITGLTAGTTYYYRVRAYNANGTTVNSNTITQATLASAPGTPTATAASSLAATSFAANWNAAAGATGYFLDVATDNLFTTFVTNYNNRSVGNVLTFSVTGLTAGGTYYYRVRASNAGGTSANSNTISQRTLPAAPVATAATSVTFTSINANWNAAAGATGYRLDVATDNLFTAFVPGFNNLDVGNVLTDSIPGLTSGTTYYYRVRGYNTGGTGANSNTISQTTLVNAPDVPIATGATAITPTSFIAHWDAVSGAALYRLDVAKLASFGPVVHTTVWDQVVVGQGTTSYAVSGLGPDTTYFFRVRAENAAGVSLSSNTITVTRILSASPMAPGTVNVPYSAILLVASDTELNGWTVSSGALPAGMTLDATTGTVAGTPTAAGTFTFTAQCTDGVSNISKSFTLPIVSTPTIALDAVSHGDYFFNNGANYRQTLVWAHTVAPPPATNRMLIVQTGSTGQSTRPVGNITVASVTYNDVPMIRGARKSNSDLSTSADFINIEQWYLLDASLPNDGLQHNVVVTYTDSTTGTGGCSLSLLRVAQSAPEATATDSIISFHLGKSITTLSNNAWLINAAVNGYSGTFYTVPTQEQRHQLDNGNFDMIVDTKARLTAGLDSMKANHHIEYRMAQVILAVAPAGTQPNVNIKAFLAGPYAAAGDSMTNGLKTSGQLAAHFTGRPIPALAVDSIAVEIRDSVTVAASHVRLFAPAWLLTDGSIRDFGDTTKPYVTFGSANTGNYYVIVRHRNHLPVMTPTALNLTAAVNPAAYDFSTGQAAAYGTLPMAAKGTRFALYAGDAGGNGIVSYNNANNDRALVYARIGGASFNATVSGYYNEDINMDGTVSYNNANNDRASIYATVGGASFNATVVSQVPN